MPIFTFIVCLFLQAGNLVRVPFEVTKQRMQANRQLKPIAVVKHALQSEVSPTLGACMQLYHNGIMILHSKLLQLQGVQQMW